MKLYPLALALSLIASPLALSQENENQDNVSQASFWEADVPGGKYLVSLSRISSISMSKYYLKGLVVHEVDVETMGVALARFYAIEVAGESNGVSAVENLSNRAKEIANQAGGKAGVDASTAVHKEYPLTTHAKTIEFRLADVDDLTALYASIEKAWKSGRGRKFTIK